PIAATFPRAASRACTSGSRSGSGIPVPAAVSGLRARTRSRTSRKIAISSALSTFLPIVGGGDDGSESAAGGECADHGRRDRVGCLHHVAKDAIDDVFLKDADVSVRKKVHLVAFQLQTALIRDVFEQNLAEVGKAGLRTDRSEFRSVDFDLVIGILV